MGIYGMVGYRIKLKDNIKKKELVAWLNLSIIINPPEDIADEIKSWRLKKDFCIQVMAVVTADNQLTINFYIHTSYSIWKLGNFFFRKPVITEYSNTRYCHSFITLLLYVNGITSRDPYYIFYNNYSDKYVGPYNHIFLYFSSHVKKKYIFLGTQISYTVLVKHYPTKTS